jgi:hypothetical protein
VNDISENFVDITHHSHDESSRLLWNVGQFLWDYTAQILEDSHLKTHHSYRQRN